ncbi:MAG: ring-hydroxylating dioxygenase, large terminal subunit [Mycobacterium sp.]|nr:ring-hydroxylating dioxygenase, large terminal subunit [Mycobacterium sp.]
MSRFTDFTSRVAKEAPFKVLPALRWSAQRPTYRDAVPAVIEAALRRSQHRPSGNWYAFAASDAVRHRPIGASVAGRELVAWRGEDATLHVGPGACPHLGADLGTGRVECGALICPWHGLRLDGGSKLGWRPYPSHDDGVLAWVRLDDIGHESPTDTPVITMRPKTGLSAVTRLVGTCEPRDIVANRLDPWHGAWFHPYSFTRLKVLSSPPIEDDATEHADRFLVAVTFRVGKIGIPVIAEFTSPEPRTIVMRIVEGEGTGSVVETHATPLRSGPDGLHRTAVLEAVLAHSDRPGFAHAMRCAPVFKPFMRRAAARLWRDDLEYAERTYRLRTI